MFLTKFPTVLVARSNPSPAKDAVRAMLEAGTALSCKFLR